jgi:hypothetical protein
VSHTIETRSRLQRLRLASFGFALLALLWTGRAAALTVALLRPARDDAALDEALFRLQGELLALGVSVAFLDGPPNPGSDSGELRSLLARAGRERGIDAFIAVAADDGTLGADVWIRDESSSALRRSHVELASPAGDRAETLAIRAIEVLRSNFVALDLAAGEPASPKRSAPEPVRPEPAAPIAVRPLGLEAGASALMSFGRVGPALLGLARVDWALGPWLSLQATAAGLGTRPRVETSAGTVEVARELGLAGACFCARSPRGVQPLLAVSAGALRTRLDARATAPNLGHHAERWAALVDAAVGARLGLPGRVYLTFAAHLELAEPYVAIHVLDSVLATTGRPNLLLTLSAGVRP